MLSFQATKILTFLFFAFLSNCFSSLTTQLVPQAPNIFFITQFFPSPVHLTKTASTLIFQGAISRISQYKDRVIDRTFQADRLQIKISSEYKIDGYHPDVEIRIQYRNLEIENNILTLVILVTKSMLEQPGSVVGILNLGKQEFKINLNKVKGLTQEFRGYWHEEEGSIVILKPEVLIISQKQYVKLRALLKEQKVEKDMKEIQWRWSKVNNRKIEANEL